MKNNINNHNMSGKKEMAAKFMIKERTLIKENQRKKETKERFEAIFKKTKFHKERKRKKAGISENQGKRKNVH